MVRHQTGTVVLLQNTVNPWSRLIREKTRFAGLMGNRGVIHDQEREIRHQTWASRRWICCAKEFKGIDRRPLFRTAPFSYTELFFLDEATAFSAGHRPCNDCRKVDLLRFKQLWADAFVPSGRVASLTVGEIDAQLHRERINDSGGKATYSARQSSLPSGAMFTLENEAYLVRDNGIRIWSPSGYMPAAAIADSEVEVLTPLSIVQLLRRGLPVQVHPSADA